jgi:elongator complex protein 3
MLTLGTTRVELGVQSTYDEVLLDIERGHTVEDSKLATRIAKDAGLKVCYHMMPGLPGSSPEMDIESFKTLFEDSDFKPDMLKIYPCLVVEGTKLHKLWLEGGYKPYSTLECADLIAEIKEFIPEWVRIQRIQRDIPVKLIEDGVDKSNLRQMVQNNLKELGKSCNCIRCREVGISTLKGEKVDMESISFKHSSYPASKGMEHFITFEDKNGILIAYCRLREPSESAHRDEISSSPCMIVRELKVAGDMVPIGKSAQFKWQHKGYGAKLLKNCENIVLEAQIDRILVTSGVGTRDYYRKFGYEREGPYMAKSLNIT